MKVWKVRFISIISRHQKILQGENKVTDKPTALANFAAAEPHLQIYRELGQKQLRRPQN